MTMLLALLIGTGGCLLFAAAPGAAALYDSYVIFLLVSSLGGGALLTSLSGRMGAQAQALKARVEELELALRHLEDAAGKRE